MSDRWEPPLPAMPAPPAERAWPRLPVPPAYEAQWRRLAGARPADPGAAATLPDQDRGPRAPAHRGVVRAGPGLARDRRAVPVAAPRPCAPDGAPGRRPHRGRRVVGAGRADRVARLGVLPRPVPRACRQPMGAAGAAPRPGPRLRRGRPTVHPGTAGHLRQARRADGAAPAHDRTTVAARVGRGAGGAVPDPLLRLLPPSR